MESLFASLSRAVEGAPAVALGASAVWGILSIILSPCHLASLPLIVGFISGQGRVSTARAGGIATLFAVGILVTIAAIGVITATAGRMMGDVGRWGNYFVAAIFFVVGLHLLGVVPMPWSGPGRVGMRRKGLLAAFVGWDLRHSLPIDRWREPPLLAAGSGVAPSGGHCSMAR